MEPWKLQIDMKPLKLQIDSGGSPTHSRKDCVIRAIAVAAEIPYEDVVTEIEMRKKRERGKCKSGNGVKRGVFTNKVWFKEWLQELGFTWTPTMKIGSGCKVHLREGELPMGRLIVSLSRHYVAVIDGVVHDTSDPSRNGIRCVYGYWKLNNKKGK